MFIVKATEVSVSGIVFHIIFESTHIFHINEIQEIQHLSEDYIARHHGDRRVLVSVKLILVYLSHSSYFVISKTLKLSAFTNLKLYFLDLA